MRTFFSMIHFNKVHTTSRMWWCSYLLEPFFNFLLLCSHIFTSGVDSGVGFVWSIVYISFPCFHIWYLSGWNFFTNISIDIFTMSFRQVHWNTMNSCNKNNNEIFCYLYNILCPWVEHKCSIKEMFYRKRTSEYMRM